MIDRALILCLPDPPYEAISTPKQKLYRDFQATYEETSRQQTDWGEDEFDDAVEVVDDE